VVTAVALLIIAGAIQVLAHFSWNSIALLYGYVGINLLYSFGLKNYPIVDVAILSLGFVLRVYYGGVALDINVSKWLYLAILAFSFYMSLGKRRNELRSNGAKTRKVNRYYTQDFLDKNMYVFFALTIVYYSMWVIDPAQIHKRMIWTVPLVIVIAMTYSLAVEGAESDGDPVSVVLNNKPLFILSVIAGLLMLGLVYV
jgi:4-hydroxybenzoate polyprenyltransferase